MTFKKKSVCTTIEAESTKTVQIRNQEIKKERAGVEEKKKEREEQGQRRDSSTEKEGIKGN